jgi:glycosidase
MRAIPILMASTFVLVASAASCGGPDAPSGTQPPGTWSPTAGSGGTFNPGDGGVAGTGAYAASGASGGTGGASGQDSGGGGGDAGASPDAPQDTGPPICADEHRRCPHEFTYPVGTETSVELRGDFAADGWDKGVALAKGATGWSAQVPLPWSFEVQYKYLVDGKTWVSDPTNPNKVSDGQGGFNSVVKAETCAWWSCSQDPAPAACDSSVRRCNHKFLYPLGTEKAVDLMGDFAADGWTKGVPMTADGSFWKAYVQLPWGGDVQYKFRVTDANNQVSWKLDPNNPLTIGTPPTDNSLLKNVTCGWWACQQFGTFDWRDAVLYFVFVDRFLDGNPANNGAPIAGVQQPAAYQGGDWAGVLQKIQDGYFNDLGVNALWLTVPMNNPDASGMGTDAHLHSAYHGYWPSDLDKTEERFGTLAELKAVVDAAHAKKIRVILDYAMNHVHISSPAYTQHPGWFWPLDYSSKHCVCGEGCSWDDSYEAKRCWFRDYLPDFNFTVPEARAFSVDNAVKWVQDTGVDGFRLDAVKHIEDAWITDLRAKIKAEVESKTKERFYMVGETYTGKRDLIKYYVNPSTMLDGQFDFPLRMSLAAAVLMRKGSMQDLDGFLGSNDTYYGSGIMSTFIGNHDIPRSIHLAQDAPLWNDEWTDGKNLSWTAPPGLPAGTSAFERLANAFTILFTMRGVPLVYYGDEVGMPGAGDPDNRRMMQWSGYSAGQSALFAHVKKLGAIRAAHSALRRGTRTTVSVTADTYAYKMADSSDTVYVLVNRGDAQQSIGGLPSGSFEDQLTKAPVAGPSVPVPARSSMILVAK